MFVSHTRHVGTRMTGKGTGIVVGTKTCIRTCTHGTLTRVPVSTTTLVNHSGSHGPGRHMWNFCVYSFNISFTNVQQVRIGQPLSSTH